MTIKNIHDFIKSLHIYNKPTVYRILTCFKKFLLFANEEAYCDKNFSFYIPKISYLRKSKIPAVHSVSDIMQIIDQVERSNPIGKRNYAIILLAAKLGLRSSDISNLSFDNFNWENNIIEFIQKKTKRYISLPLLNEVGDAVIDYLKYGRPSSELKNIFLSHHVPISPISSSTIYGIVSTQFKRTDIKPTAGKSIGPHSLRHSLASNLLEQGKSMYIVQDVLGHSSIETTKGYIHINTIQLKKCALSTNFKSGEYNER